MEQPLLQERALHIATGRLAVVRFVGKGQCSPKLEFFSDRAEVTSMGGLPYGVTEDDFFGGCSVPRNKEIMRVFRDLEIVEHLGSGVPRIVNAYGKEAFEIRDSYVRIIFRFSEAISAKVDERDGDQVGTKSGLSRDQVKILHNCMKEKAIGDLMLIFGRTNRTKFRNQVIKPLLDQGLLEMTIPDKPTSSKQKYRLTSHGLVTLKNMNEGRSGGL